MSFLTTYTMAADMSTSKWMTLPIQWVDVARLTPTQDVEADLWSSRRPMEAACRDPHVHVVQLGSVMYLEDGHHRVARARRDHEWQILARVLVL
jgi:hypothetical protein